MGKLRTDTLSPIHIPFKSDDQVQHQRHREVRFSWMSGNGRECLLQHHQENASCLYFRTCTMAIMIITLESCGRDRMYAITCKCSQQTVTVLSSHLCLLTLIPSTSVCKPSPALPTTLKSIISLIVTSWHTSVRWSQVRDADWMCTYRGLAHSLPGLSGKAN